MRRCRIVGNILAALLLALFLLWQWCRGNKSTPDVSKPPPQRLASAEVATPDVERPLADVGSNAVPTNQETQFEKALQFYNQGHTTPVAFYGRVVDQDSNNLESVTVDLEVVEQYVDPYPQVKGKTTMLRRQTREDGRFEVSGLHGNFITVLGLKKEGYEPERIQKHYGMYGPQSTSFYDPTVFTMWRTNLHEPLITGEKSFVIIPDGRHYAIDLLKGTIADGEEGDLVIWIKRPESVQWGQRYDWTCELTAVGGGLVAEDKNSPMSMAPETGYTKVFRHEEEATVNGWGGATGDKRFYVQLRNGQIYGRIVINLYADFHGKQPAMIKLSYAVNPAGSRLLR